MAETCFGCTFLLEKCWGDGSRTFSCKKKPGIVIGEYCSCCGDYREPKPLEDDCKAFKRREAGCGVESRHTAGVSAGRIAGGIWI